MIYSTEVKSERNNKIRSQHNVEKRSLNSLAREYNISRQTIMTIMRWKPVPLEITALCIKCEREFTTNKMNRVRDKMCKKCFPYPILSRKVTGRERTRFYVRLRDKFTCQECKNVRTPEQAKVINRRLFDVHHLNGLCGKKSKGYDKVLEMDGLITLCHKCHYNRHDHSRNY